jgi:TonB family protein
MNWLIDTNAKISLLILIALGAGLVLRRHSAAVRHWVFAIAVASAAATPLLTAMAPSWHVALDLFEPAAPVASSESVVTTTTFLPVAASTSGSAADTAVATPGAAPAWTAGDVATWIWMAGAGAGLLILLVGQIRLGSLASRARRIEDGRWAALTNEISRELGVRRRVVLLEGAHPTLLGTWGVFRPKVVLPRAALSWSDARARIVLRHELAHVGRGDWVVMITAACLRAVYWFNPLLWIVTERVRQESEYACDDAVLNCGVDGPEYAGHLVELARTLNTRRSWLPAPAMARPSNLEGRISAMLNAKTNRRPLRLSGRVATAMALLSFTVSIAGFAAQASFFTLSGVLMDTTNRVLTRVTVRLINARSEAKYEVKSDATGRFEFVGLPPGEYAFEALMPGFQPYKEKVAIIGRNIDRTIQLQVGSLEETITVGNVRRVEPTADEIQRRQEQRKRIDETRQARLEKCSSEGANADPTGGRIVPPIRLANTNPVYPQQLFEANIGGTVTMETTIGTDGDVRDVRVTESAHPELENAAIDAVRQWQYSQTLLNCVPIEVRMIVTTRFVAQP